MKKNKWVPLFCAAIFLCFIPMLIGSAKEEEKLDGHEVARRSNFRPGYKKDESTALQMKIIDAHGKARIREFIRYQKSFKSGKKTLMKFLYPNDIKDTGTLNEEVRNKDDIQYLYLPAAKKLRRVSIKKQSWMGSDFNYEDLMEEELEDFHYELIGEDIFDGYECYVYSMIPKSTDKSIYGKQIRWVHKKDYLPTKREIYDKEGRLLKVITFTDFRETSIRGVSYAWIIKVENMQDKHRTEIFRRWIYLDSGIDSDYLSTRNLEKSVDFYSQPKDLWKIWRAAMAEQPNKTVA